MNLQRPFKEPYKIDGKFGDIRSGYIHAGVDYNGIGGGDTDLGYKLYPICDGEITHVSKADVSYGNVVVYKIEGVWGTKWVRYCHCNTINCKVGDKVNKDTIIATLGKTGNADLAHLHCDLIKNPLTNWRMYAKDLTVLNNYFEDFEEFFKQFGTIDVMADNRIKLLDEYVGPSGDDLQTLKSEGDVRSALERVRKWNQLDTDKKNAQKSLLNWEEVRDDIGLMIDTSLNTPSDVLGAFKEVIVAEKVTRDELEELKKTKTSPAWSFSQDDYVKIGKSIVLTSLASIAFFAADYLKAVDFGNNWWVAIVTPAVPLIVNILIKFAKENKYPTQ